MAIKTAFNALVHPILEYACPVWNPYLVSDDEKPCQRPLQNPERPC